MSQPTLEALADKALSYAAVSGLLAYCPSMDLVAIGLSRREVAIFRLNGQKVHSICHKDETVEPQKIAWKPNGLLLAIAWSDGIVRLVGTESGKTVHEIRIAKSTPEPITCLAWACNSTPRVSKVGQLEDAVSQGALNCNLPGEQWESDLPRDLSLIDLESSLPKLSTIPSGGTLDDVFSTRSSLDSLFNLVDPQVNDEVDVLLTGTNSGQMHVSIYDSFVVGSFQAKAAKEAALQSTEGLILHAAHKDCSTRALLLESNGRLRFATMDLRFVTASRGHLSLLAAKSTSLHNLLRYIHQVQALMTAEWKATQELPSRFLGNIDEDLAANNQPNIVQAMYHSVATGHTLPAVREWLVDQLAERGHKRWDKAVSSGLENLRRLIHENMLPALERCGVILSRLMGIAKYQSSTGFLGYSTQQISSLMDTTACLSLVSSKMLTGVVEEIDAFAVFSAWLRQEIDRLASPASDDMVDKESSVDHSKVLRYIQIYMTDGPLNTYFQDLKSDEYQKELDMAGKGLPIFEPLTKQLHLQESGLPYIKSLPKIELLCSHLEVQAGIVFQQIAEAEKRNVLIGQPIELTTTADQTIRAVTLCSKDVNQCCAYIAVASFGGGNIQFHEVDLHIVNGISKPVALKTGIYGLGDKVVLDILFLDDQTLLALCRSSDSEYSIACIRYRSSGHITYLSGRAGHDITTPQQSSAHNYSLPQDPQFKPSKMVVSQGSFSADESSLIKLCILGDSRFSYRVFGMPRNG